jgi:hypothetical protein
VRRLLIVALVLLGFSCTAAFAATLGVGSWHLWAGSQTLTKGTCTLTGSTQTLDTFVNESSTSQTNGSATTMQVLGFSGFRRYAFVRFDLSSCNIPSSGGADSATLSLRITTAPSSNRTINVTPVTSTWNESLTWTLSQALSLGSSPTTSFTTGTTSNVTKTVTVTADVDDQIKTGAVFGWRLSDTGSSFSTTTFGSSENGTAANRPVLTISYEK